MDQRDNFDLTLNRCVFIFIVLIPFCWVKLSIGSLYRLITIVLFGLYIISNRFCITTDGLNRNLRNQFGIFITFCSLSALWCSDLHAGINNAMGYILLFLVVCVFSNISANSRANHNAKLAWIIMGVVCVVLFFTGDRSAISEYSSRTSMRILGASTDPNEFAGAIIVPATMTLLLLIETKKLYLKVAMGVIFSLELYIVILTGSRGALLSLLFAIGITLFTSKYISLRTLLFVLIAIVVFSLVFLKYVLPTLPTDIVARMSLESLSSDQGSGRVGIWSSAVQQYWNGPLYRIILGYGVTGLLAGDIYQTCTMHNQFIQVLISYGLPGLCLYLGLILTALKQIIRRNREFLGSFLGMLLMSMTITTGPSYKPFWLLLMMAFFYTNVESEFE